MLDDVAYMDNEEERREYVLADHGRIWVGSQRNNWGIPWVFGQVLVKSKETIPANSISACCNCLKQGSNIALTELTRLGLPK